MSVERAETIHQNVWYYLKFWWNTKVHGQTSHQQGSLSSPSFQIKVIKQQWHKNEWSDEPRYQLNKETERKQKPICPPPPEGQRAWRIRAGKGVRGVKPFPNGLLGHNGHRDHHTKSKKVSEAPSVKREWHRAHDTKIDLASCLLYFLVSLPWEGACQMGTTACASVAKSGLHFHASPRPFFTHNMLNPSACMLEVIRSSS